MDWKHYISSIITVQILRSQFKSWGYQNSFPVLLKHDNKSGPLTFWLMGCCSELRDFKGLVLLPPPPALQKLVPHWLCLSRTPEYAVQMTNGFLPGPTWAPLSAPSFQEQTVSWKVYIPTPRSHQEKKMFGSTWTELGHSDQVFSIIV